MSHKRDFFFFLIQKLVNEIAILTRVYYVSEQNNDM